MARRISSSRGRSFGGGGFKGSSFKSSGSRSGGFRSSSFKPRTSYNLGGYHRHHSPYRRNYFYHSLGPVGKVIYIIGVIVLLVILTLFEAY